MSQSKTEEREFNKGRGQSPTAALNSLGIWVLSLRLPQPQTSPNLHFSQSSQSFPWNSKQRHHCFLFFNQDGICLPSHPSQCGWKIKPEGAGGGGDNRSFDGALHPLLPLTSSLNSSTSLSISQASTGMAGALNWLLYSSQSPTVATNMGYTPWHLPTKTELGTPQMCGPFSTVYSGLRFLLYHFYIGWSLIQNK